MRQPEHRSGIDRRSFLQGIAVGSAAPLAALAAAEGGNSRVAVAKRAELTGGRTVDRDTVKEALSALVKKLSGKSNVDEAWRTFVSPKETVAIKFNGLFPRASTHPHLIWAICRGLVDAGMPAEKIIVFDRKVSDFKTARIKTFADMAKIRFAGSDSGWGPEVKAGPFKTRLPRILTDDADAVISVPILKHHVVAGVSLAMKNHIGSVPNPRDYHDKIDAIAELNGLPPIAKKTRLAVCDAMVAIFDKGPQFRGAHCCWEAHSLLASADQVALDAVGAEMIRKARAAHKAGRTRPDPSHIAHAAEIGLGTADLKKIEIVNV